MSQLPVTVLSGFLGAGKTSLLNYLLTNADGMRLGVIVNDMSEINVDARLVESRLTPKSAFSDAMIEMTNGCICCTIREEFVEAVADLAARGELDYLIVEATGISEPLAVAEGFTFDVGSGRQLSELARLDSLVTVVDASSFLPEMGSLDTLAVRNQSAGDTDERHVSELLVDQVEFANVLILNKIDLVSPSQRSTLIGLLQRMNPKAKLVLARNGQVSPEMVLNTKAFRFSDAAEFPAWLEQPRLDRTPETDLYGIDSFVYNARRPFHPERLWETLQRSFFTNVLRSKGFVWLASRPDQAGLWSQTGRLWSLEPAGKWWVTVPRDQWPCDDPAQIMDLTDWDEDLGDRRQEIVFIGQNLNEEGIRGKLDACLMTGQEMEQIGQSTLALEDPFPQWDFEEQIEISHSVVP